MAVAQDAAAIFAIKQTNEKISTNKHKAKGLGSQLGRCHLAVAAAGTDKTHDNAIAFCYIFTYLPPYICLYLSDTEKI